MAACSDADEAEEEEEGRSHSSIRCFNAFTESMSPGTLVEEDVF